MRIALNGAVVAVLAVGIVGCGQHAASRPAKPVVATVTLKVPGMT